jgi:putative flippase GtrA
MTDVSVTHETLALRAPARRSQHLDVAFELSRFLGVGAVGYIVNLAVYATLIHPAAIGYGAASVLAFVFALATTFVLNRYVTFGAGGGSLVSQAWRYVLVNLTGFATMLLVLAAGVELAHVAEIPAQAIAAAAAAPVNYLGGRIWAFAH